MTGRLPWEAAASLASLGLAVLQAAIGFMKFLFWFQSLPQFTVGLAQARATAVAAFCSPHRLHSDEGSAMGSGIGLLCACLGLGPQEELGFGKSAHVGKTCLWVVEGDMVLATSAARFTCSEALRSIALHRFLCAGKWISCFLAYVDDCCVAIGEVGLLPGRPGTVHHQEGRSPRPGGTGLET